jgi:diguanylate cyclase (GGDEF)-like protein
MTSVRPHREQRTSEQAIAELHRCAGTQFDPKLVKALVEVLAHPNEHPVPALPTPAQAADLLVSRETAGRRRLQAQLSYQADHDLLTGLLNRRRFAEELERVLRYAARYRRSGALLILDIDNLKLVNDLHGHAAGDEAVKLVADVIRTRTRSTDIAGRLGGDELAIVLHEAGEREALHVTDELRLGLEQLAVDPPLRASVGVALFDSDQKLVADDLLTAADIALYDAKQAGDRQPRVYHGDTAAALKWVQRIRSALSEERFVLYAQPIVSLHEHREGSSEPHERELRRELLVRMLSDDGDAIPPSAFIPTAKRFGLITEIDRWVTAQGLALAAAGERVNINLSAHSMDDGGILEQVRSAVRAGLAPGHVVFELTETATMANMQDARVFSQRLKDLGCDVALDDFGTGFGSFSYLKHLPARYLKIDIEFVRNLVSSVTDQHVVRAITDVGHSLGKLIVAEGIEDASTLQVLREYGVDYAQGYYLGAPERITPATRWERGATAGRASAAAPRTRS